MSSFLMLRKDGGVVFCPLLRPLLGGLSLQPFFNPVFADKGQ